MQAENYVGKSLTKLNELLNNGELRYKPPISKADAVEAIRNYAETFPLKYVAEHCYYVHGNTGISSLCNVLQIPYSDVMLDARTIPYEIKGEYIEDAKAEVREILLKECDFIMSTDDIRAIYPHVCVMYAVVTAYTNYRNSMF